MLLMIDNYDSFTYNLVQYLGELSVDLAVYRNDKITVKEALVLSPDKIVISPGPCTPNEAGVSLDIIQEFAPNVPVLGVCLGHQAIGQAFGGKVVKAPKPVHGKTSEIYHNGKGLFKGIKNPFTATRYHSLVVEKETLPDVLEITAEADGLIMGLKHKNFSVFGIQFHPESILTGEGKKILKNFIEIKETK
jgi:anthranilate synthase/aminodeoxychorismate synthase-like glutamine amidotransferase